MEELLKLLGLNTIYAGAAYGFFHWLDANASDEAKAALTRTMSLKDYKSEQVASALVELFDRIYTYPLLRWRAFFRSLLFTTVVSAIWLFEEAPWLLDFSSQESWSDFVQNWRWVLEALFFNVSTDYLSLFVIRPLLVRSGTKPVIGLALGAVSAIAIVIVTNVLRAVVMHLLADHFGWGIAFHFPIKSYVMYALPWGPFGFQTEGLHLAWPALAVFVWLPLFALGIAIARLLTPLSWIVGRTQWFLEEGKEHPLKAIGYVAALVTFLGTVAARAIFGV